MFWQWLFQGLCVFDYINLSESAVAEAVYKPSKLNSRGCIFSISAEKATDGSLQNEDWALNMEICDIINETEEG